MKKNPRVLIVTPEITYLPAGMGNMADTMSAKAGGLADVSASLVGSLFEQGADVHVALPHYRKMFHVDVSTFIDQKLRRYQEKMPGDRIHLAEDRAFYYRDTVYSTYGNENPRLALIFQREVINNIIGHVRPDLIHCNDWMTGLVPAAARRLGIPCLFTVHNIHTHEVTLERIEEEGIDAAEFWENLYYKRPPWNYEESRANNAVDMMASGIFAAHYINCVSPTFLKEVVDGRHAFVPASIHRELAAKYAAGCAEGVLNAPDDSYDPETDEALPVRYDEKNHAEGKRAAKRLLQERLGLDRDDDAPLFFWPSRLDPVQKGCALLSDILYRVVNAYWDKHLQVVFVANGSHQRVFADIVNFHNIANRVAVAPFDESLSRLGYAASDFMLMPSLFEPCGLPQMIAPLYGSLPIVRNCGGLHDTVIPMTAASNFGNGFLFDDYDAEALLWGIAEAMRFRDLPPDVQHAQIERVMLESRHRFNHKVCAQTYRDIYERMLHRPLV
ncbi:MAG: glycogen/starch synthase [Kiritimatiellaeota bacterium]|nr:glycogen/starch synthase [Kiritimatiellota bacterium]